jgi:hypothetical protein
MNTDPYVLGLYSFVSVLVRRLLEQEVFTQQEVIALLDAWFGDMLGIASSLEKAGVEGDAAEVLKMINRITAEFSPPK